MLLPERGKQAISNETKGGQPPFAFLAVMSLKRDGVTIMNVPKADLFSRKLPS
jgi:hypothetical protein